MKYQQTIAEKDLWSKDRISKLTPEQKTKLTEIIVEVNRKWLPIDPKKRKDRIYGIGLVYIRYLLGYSGEEYNKEEWNKRLEGHDISLFK